MSNPESHEFYSNLTAQSLVESETPLNVALRTRRKELGLEQQQLAEIEGEILQSTPKNVTQIIDDISKYSDSYRWSSKKIEQFVQLYKGQEGYSPSDIRRALPVVEKLREVWKLRAKFLKSKPYILPEKYQARKKLPEFIV